MPDIIGVNTRNNPDLDDLISLNEAAEKLDELLTVIDVSSEIKRIGEHQAAYNT